MSMAYEGLVSVGQNEILNCKKVWSDQDCPFDDIGFGELIFAVYGTACRVERISTLPGPEMLIQQSVSQLLELIAKMVALAEMRRTVGFLSTGRLVSEPLPLEHVRIALKGGRLGLIFSTEQETWNELDKNSCIMLNIALDNFEPGRDLEWGGLFKILSTADTQQAFRNPFPLQFIQLDQNRLETLYPKADLEKFTKSTPSGSTVLQNLHVVLKFSRTGVKAEGEWIKRQQLMGNKLQAEGLLSDFAIKADGKTIPCHRNFLAGRSAVLARMFESNWVEGQNGTLTMEDMSAEGVEAFLKYIYSSSLVDAMANSNLAFEMLYAGHKYEIRDLESVCKKILHSAKSDTFHAATAFEMHHIGGNVDGFAALQGKAVRVLKDNAEKFKETGEIRVLFEYFQSADFRKAFNDWICSVPELSLERFDCSL